MSSVPGLPVQTMIAPNGGTPREAAMNNMQANNKLQANATKALAGGRRRRRALYGGADGTITIAPNRAPYPETVGAGQSTNSQSTDLAKISTQQAANRQFDKVGGSSRRKRGGNPNWHWGCMSGGKRKSRRQTGAKKSKKTKRSKKSRRHRGTRRM